MKGIGIFILSLISLNAIAQNAVLRSGPVIGYVDSTRAYIWIDPEPGTTKFRVTWFEKGSKKTSDSLEITRNQKDTLPVTFKIKNLNPATSYSIRITVDDKPVTHGYAPGFTTASAGNNKPEQFSFLFGSCLYLNDPGETKQYGNDPGILNEMSLKQSDFMIWGGDNFYLRNNEWKTREGIVSRYNKTRRFLFIQPLMGSRANFAICDDHDYGPDDCTGTYDLASFSRETFKQYWPTKSYSDNHGLYQKFTWNDCEFS